MNIHTNINKGQTTFRIKKKLYVQDLIVSNNCSYFIYIDYFEKNLKKKKRLA